MISSLTIFLPGAKPTNSEAVVSDSGAESCTEDKLRTAQVFMTGIQSAILSSTIPDVPGDSGEDIVSEVRELRTSALAISVCLFSG